MTISRLLRGFLRRLGIWWQSYYIMQASIDIDIINQKLSELSLKIPYTIIRLKYADLLKGEKEFYTDNKLKKYKDWINDKNREAYGIIINNELAYSSWICFNKIELTAKTIINNYDKHALLQDAYCNKKYRGLGIHNYVNMFMLTVIYNKKYYKVMSIVMTKNLPAIKTQEKSTLRITQEISLFSFLGKEILKYK